MSDTAPREFNTFGPVDPKLHYHVNRLEVKAAIREKIKKGRYFTLNAARQTGKTTLFREVIAELEAEGAYFGLLLDFETLRGYERTEFYYWLKQEVVETWQASHPPHDRLLTWLHQVKLTEHNGFGQLLRHLTAQSARRGVLIIDEFDAIETELAEPMLAVFRKMYLKRTVSTYHALQSIILVGVRNIPAMLGGSQSPFNIADQYEVPYFTASETADLLSQHTTATGQPITSEVVEAIYRETEGQPFLVNRLGQILTRDIVPDRPEPIAPSHFEQALSNLLAENNTHFSSIVSKATPHRSVLLPLLFYDEKRSKFRDPVTQELLMYGILRRVREGDLWLARLANPIYRKMLILTFTPANGDLPLNGSFRHRYLVGGVLDMAGLLDSFKAMMEEHGIRLLRSKQTDRPLEIGGQYLLLSYLTAALDSIGGHVTLGAVNSAGELDLLVFYRSSRFIIETKIWYGAKRFEAGQEQLAAYLTAANLERGYIVLFSEQSLAAALGPEAGNPFEVMVGAKGIRVYPVVIGG